MYKLQDLETKRLGEVLDCIGAIREKTPVQSHLCALSKTHKWPWKAHSLHICLSHRMLEISSIAHAQLNAGRLIPGFILARAAMETMALHHLLRVKLEQANAEQQLTTDMDEFLVRASLGTKDPRLATEVPNAFQAMNVLTTIETHLAKTFPKIDEVYDRLSDFAHPNAMGLTHIYQHVDDAGTQFFGPNVRSLPIIEGINGLLSSVLIFEFDAAKIAEVLPQFVKLCEEKVHPIKPSTLDKVRFTADNSKKNKKK